MYILDEKLTADFLSYLLLDYRVKIQELLSQENIYVAKPVFGNLCTRTTFEGDKLVRELALQDKNFTPENSYFKEDNFKVPENFFMYWIFKHEQDAPEFTSAQEAQAYIAKKLTQEK